MEDTAALPDNGLSLLFDALWWEGSGSYRSKLSYQNIDLGRSPSPQDLRPTPSSVMSRVKLDDEDDILAKMSAVTGLDERSRYVRFPDLKLGACSTMSFRFSRERGDGKVRSP